MQSWIFSSLHGPTELILIYWSDAQEKNLYDYFDNYKVKKDQFNTSLLNKSINKKKTSYWPIYWVHLYY